MVSTKPKCFREQLTIAQISTVEACSSNIHNQTKTPAANHVQTPVEYPWIIRPETQVHVRQNM